MSCKEIYVKFNSTSGVSADKFYDLVDENNAIIFQNISASSLATGLTFSIASSTTRMLLSSTRLNASVFSCPLITTNLIVYYDAGKTASYNGSGTTVFDLSGNNLNGTLTNGASFESTPVRTFVFDGINDFLNINNNALLNQTGPITISVWFRASYGDFSGLVDKGRDNYGAWALYTDSASNKIVWKARVAATNHTLLSSSTFPQNTWTHVTAVYSGSQLLIYLNGNLDNTLSSVTGALSTNSNNLVLGKLSDDLDFLTGRISEFQYYSVALTSAQIRQNFLATKSKYI